MITVASTTRASRSPGSGLVNPYIPSQGNSLTSRELDAKLLNMLSHTSPAAADASARSQAFVGSEQLIHSTETLRLPTKSVAEALYESLVAAKVATSKVSMHLPSAWRARLFRKLDDLLDVDDWHDEDRPLIAESFMTFLRFVLLMKPDRDPAFGISDDGYLLAAWTVEQDRLTLEFLPNDNLRWIVVRYIDEDRETAAGRVTLGRLISVLGPYAPEHWFANGSQAHS